MRRPDRLLLLFLFVTSLQANATPLLVVKTKAGLFFGTNQMASDASTKHCKVHMSNRAVVLRASPTVFFNGIDFDAELDKALQDNEGSINETKELVIRSTEASLRKVVTARPVYLLGRLEDLTNNFIIGEYNAQGGTDVEAFTLTPSKTMAGLEYSIKVEVKGLGTNQMLDWSGGGKPTLQPVSPAADIRSLMFNILDQHHIKDKSQGGHSFDPPYTIIRLGKEGRINRIDGSPEICKVSAGIR